MEESRVITGFARAPCAAYSMALGGIRGIIVGSG